MNGVGPPFDPGDRLVSARQKRARKSGSAGPDFLSPRSCTNRKRLILHPHFSSQGANFATLPEPMQIECHFSRRGRQPSKIQGNQRTVTIFPEG